MLVSDPDGRRPHLFNAFPSRRPAAAAQPSLDRDADDARPGLSEGIELMRQRVEPRFKAAGLSMSDADLIAIVAAVSTAMSAAEGAAADAVIALRKGDRT